MSSLADDLVNAEIRNYQNNTFIPESLFKSLLTDERIRDHFESTDSLRAIEEPKKQACLQTVLKGGRRTFAVLVLISCDNIILEFMERDPMREGWTIDSNLPYSGDSLGSIFPLTMARYAKQFQQEQWKLLVPVFKEDTLHRFFSQQTILPFQYDGYRDSGGFGDVFRVELFASHQTIDPEPRKAVGISVGQSY
jgi:hypothetical protein